MRPLPRADDALAVVGRSGQSPWSSRAPDSARCPQDAVNGGGVVDGGDQLHPAGAARTAQDVQVKGKNREAMDPLQEFSEACREELRARF
jgi:hypothetical protein